MKEEVSPVMPLISVGPECTLHKEEDHDHHKEKHELEVWRACDHGDETEDCRAKQVHDSPPVPGGLEAKVPPTSVSQTQAGTGPQWRNPRGKLRCRYAAVLGPKACTSLDTHHYSPTLRKMFSEVQKSES